MESMIYIEQKDKEEAARLLNGFTNTESKKRTYINALGAELIMKYLAAENVNVSNIYNMHNIFKIREEFDISDIMLPNIHIDVRMVYNKDIIFIPKSHFEYGLTPDVYAVCSLSEDASYVDFMGFFTPEDINKSMRNSDYYFIEPEKLQKPSEFIEFVKNFTGNTTETFSENLYSDVLALNDNDISAEKKKALIKILKKSSALREEMIEFDNFEWLSYNASKENIIEKPAEDLTKDEFEVFEENDEFEGMEVAEGELSLSDDIPSLELTAEEPLEVLEETTVSDVSNQEVVPELNIDSEPAATTEETAVELSADNLEPLTDSSMDLQIGEGESLSIETEELSLDNTETLTDTSADLQINETENTTADTITEINGDLAVEDLSLNNIEDLSLDGGSLNLSDDNIQENETNIETKSTETDNIELFNTNVFDESAATIDTSLNSDKTDTGLNIEDSGLSDSSISDISLDDNITQTEDLSIDLSGNTNLEDESFSLSSDADSDSDTEVSSEIQYTDSIYGSALQETPITQAAPDEIIIPETSENADISYIDNKSEVNDDLTNLYNNQSNEVTQDINYEANSENQSADLAELENFDNIYPQEDGSIHLDLDKPSAYESYNTISSENPVLGEITIDFNEPEKTDLDMLYNTHKTEATKLNKPSSPKPKGGKTIMAVAATAAAVIIAASGAYYLMNNNNNKHPDEISVEPPTIPEVLPPIEEQPVPQDEPTAVVSHKLPPAPKVDASNQPKQVRPIGESEYLSINKIGWSVPDYVSYNKDFRDYLQTFGKSVKLSLNSDLLLATEYPYSNQIFVDIELFGNGSAPNVKISKSSASKQIDGIVLRTVKETSNVVKYPASVIVGDNLKMTLKIYL